MPETQTQLEIQTRNTNTAQNSDRNPRRNTSTNAENKEERPIWVSVGKLQTWDLGLRGLWRLGSCRSTWRKREADEEGVRRETQ